MILTRDDTLRLDRFCGHEVFGLESVDVYVQRPDENGQRLFLNLEFHCGKPLDRDVPEQEWSRSPSVELWIPFTFSAAGTRSPPGRR